MEKSYCARKMFIFFYNLSHSINLKSFEVFMSNNTRGRKHFKIYFLNCKSFGYETRPTNRYIARSNIFRKCFA